LIDRLGKVTIETVQHPDVRNTLLSESFNSTGRSATEFHNVAEVPKRKNVITKARISAPHLLAGHIPD
jgi:hypothetical protein